MGLFPDVFTASRYLVFTLSQSLPTFGLLEVNIFYVLKIVHFCMKHMPANRSIVLTVHFYPQKSENYLRKEMFEPIFLCVANSFANYCTK